MIKTTPAEAGFYMPAEWEEHEGTWLQWPHDERHRGQQMRLETLWLAMTQALHEHETVHIAVADERGREHLYHQVGYYGLDLDTIDIHLILTDDVWVRDNGPIFVVNDQGELAAIDWNFNGWGGRFPFGKDRMVPARVADLLSVPLFRAPITLEGGGIEVNGQGTLIATRTSIINPNRNPSKSQAEIEDVLKQYFGLQHIIWLSGAPRDLCDRIGDDTDYHVDGAARFTDESTVLYTWTEDRAHPEYPYLRQHRQELQAATTESGQALTLVPLPVPEGGRTSTANTTTALPFEAVPIVATYANYYVANGVVLVPVYGSVNDAVAKGILAEQFPGRKIIGIPAQVLAELGGMMHCVTQQQPSAQANR
jgi:agmatine deiminase